MRKPNTYTFDPFPTAAAIGCILALVGVLPLTATTAVVLLLLSLFSLKFTWSA